VKLNGAVSVSTARLVGWLFDDRFSARFFADRQASRPFVLFSFGSRTCIEVATKEEDRKR
jgi:hypothetical protein